MIEFILPSETEQLTEELLMRFIREHQAEIIERYNILFALYDNSPPILHELPKEGFKPDNRLAVNFAKYIVDTFNGFFMGVPVKTTHPNEQVALYLEKVQNYNDLDDSNAELSRLTAIFGRAYELLFLDENAEVGITYIDPREAFIIYDDSIQKKKLFGVRYFVNSKGDIEGSYSDKENIYYFLKDAEGLHISDDVKPNFFGDVPMIECIENDERRGAFESVYTLINAYNKAISEKANDVDYFADAYMKILGQKLDEETLQRVRDNRIINMQGDQVDKIVVEFMSKPSADATQENLINRLEKLIFQISMVANINDESFGNASGISLKYKLQSMLNMANVKERKFAALMNQRWRMIANLPNTPMAKDDWTSIRYTFTRNIPNNVLEEAQAAQAMSGIVSNETLLETLSVVPNVKQELDRKEMEREALVPSFGFLGDEEY